MISIPVGSPANVNALMSGSSNPKIYSKESSNSTRDVGENDGSEESEGIAVGFVVGLSDGSLLGFNETLGLSDGSLLGLNVALGLIEGSLLGLNETLGLVDGSLLGLIVGSNVAVGNEDGFMVGSTLGAT